MRVLNEAELVHVTGAGGQSYSCSCYCPAPSPTKQKGNNGFGQEKHGRTDPGLAAPGNSGGTPGDKEGSRIR
jgi:hypothetical protein